MLLLHMLGLAALASADTVSYDPGYDLADRPMKSVACSDGSNGLAEKWPSQGRIPGFPYIGGAQAVAAWNSPNCGTCWRLEYAGRTVHILAIDHADTGFNIARSVMDELTNGQAEQLGRIDARATQVTANHCGL